MNRLSALDAAFLYMETPKTPMHVGSVTIFAPSVAKDDVFTRFREQTAARLDLLPSYRRRLETTPLGLDHPVWVNEEQLDLDYHIRHAAVPKPGTMEQLRALVARLHEIPLDRARPLWQYYLIEGLEDGAFAVYIKIHHCAMDGVAAIGTVDVVFDLSPDVEPTNVRAHVVRSTVEPADFIELTSTAVADFVRQGVRAVKSLPGLVKALTKAAPQLAKDARFLLGYVKDMPRTPFNVAISGYRAYGTCSLPLREVKALAKSRGATINDLVLAVCAGALRRYLAEHGALPKAPLTAGVPASLRAHGDATMNNQVVFTVARLPTDLADCLPRLAASRVAAEEAKSLFADIKDMLTTDISILGAPLIVSTVASLMAGVGAANYLPPYFNVVISNIPGPRTPLYCDGAPARHYFPISIPFHGCALNITVQSYLDRLEFGLVACRETAPDVQSIADYLVEDFAAMRQADEALNRPDAIAVIEIAAAAEAAAVAAPARPPTRSAKASPAADEPDSPLARNIDALGAATTALKRKLQAAAAGSGRAPRRRSRAAGPKRIAAPPHGDSGPGAAEPALAEAASADPSSASAQAPMQALSPASAARARPKRRISPRSETEDDGA